MQILFMLLSALSALPCVMAGKPASMQEGLLVAFTGVGIVLVSFIIFAGFSFMKKKIVTKKDT